MELKPYQQQVINDLALYLAHIQQHKTLPKSFNEFWANHPKTPLIPTKGTAIEPYKDTIKGVPHICIKVPTAGGKTFIACNAIRTFFDYAEKDKPQAVVWLVPSVTILEQTIKNLKDPTHPYRQKINTHFGNRVEVFEKEALLQGSGFNASSVKEQLNIFVMSFDSIRTQNKDGRRVYGENGALQSFEAILDKKDKEEEETKDISLMRVISFLNPMLIVDESHNAETKLSEEMLTAFNPSFILDLTATPRKNSNIISFIDALELKKENMVKLPVIVYNHQDRTEVINSSLQLQKRLELLAKEEEKRGGKYIRPIVLFQAQPKNGKDWGKDEEISTVQTIKDKLIALQIPAEQIKIKTANVNEIKGIDLMSRSCKVRFIITINALKEGWDCPFAYILASLADRSSAVDVEQILGRILRQPYVKKHSFPLLNMSFVLTASAKFTDTLFNIVKGLNKAGFSEKDYKTAEITQPREPQTQTLFGQLDLPTLPNEAPANIDIATDIDVSRINLPTETALPTETVSAIEQTAITQNTEFENRVFEMERNNTSILPTEIQQLVKSYKMKDAFKEVATGLKLPQFYLKIPANDLFGEGETQVLLEKENLLQGFALGNADSNIRFENINAELYKVDLDATQNEHTPSFVRLDGKAKESIMAYLLDPSRIDSRVKNFCKRIMDIIGNMYPIPDNEIRRYVTRILEGFSDAQFRDFANNQYSYTDKIKQKIKLLSDEFAERNFRIFLDTAEVFIQPTYQLPLAISPKETTRGIPKSLYSEETKINGFEASVINEIANLPNVRFWTKNIEKKGFRINGFINHYPDFIIVTNSGKVILLETKGDHLDAEAKIRLGNAWERKAGDNYRYFLVYDRRVVNGTYVLEEFLEVMKRL